MDLVTAERHRLCDALDAAGPDAPTLCEGWATRDLAAHLVVREGEPLALPGIALPLAAGLTQRLQDRAAARPYDEVVARLRSGPPLLSPFRLPGVDAAANLVEFYVHHEDVRRARWATGADGAGAEGDAPHLDGHFWSRLRAAGWFLTRRARGTAVVLRTPDGDTAVARRSPGSPEVTLTGAPRELLLYLYNRKEVADVEVSGEPAAVTALAAARLGV